MKICKKCGEKIPNGATHSYNTLYSGIEKKSRCEKRYILKNKIPNLQITLISNFNEYRGKKRYGVEFKNILTHKREGIEITKLLDEN